MNPTQPDLFSQAKATDRRHRNHFLFSDYYLNELLFGSDAWRGQIASATAFFAELKKLYMAEKANLADYNENQLETHWIQPILQQLGWRGMYETQAVIPALVSKGIRRPDYVLFPSVGERQTAVQWQNTPTYAQNAVVVGEVKRWGVALNKKQGGKPTFENNNPSHQIDYYLRATEVRWGILTDGRYWRLVNKESSFKLDVYYEVDLQDVLVNDSPNGALYFWLFFRQGAFVPDEQGQRFVDEALAASLNYAREVENDLRDNAYKALEQLIQGFFAFGRNQLDPENQAALDRVYTNSLYLLYRLLFLMYGESRGLLPLNNNRYFEVSLTNLVNEVSAKLDVEGYQFSPYSIQYWARQQDLCHIINGTDPAANRYYAIPRYNGGLFSPVLHPFLERYKMGDLYLLRAIDYLARRDRHKQGERAIKERVDYRTLGVRQLGSIYEGLLEYRPGQATEPMATIRRKGNEVWVPVSKLGRKKPLETRAVGDLYLATDKGERKATGSYYTPDYIVRYIVEQTLQPLIADIRTGVAELPEAEQGSAFAKRVLALNVLDPAMGSGHFLVAAAEFLALALTNADIISPPDLPDSNGLSELERQAQEKNYWLRRVTEACIYGVDKNGMAVELAKLSLWLTTVSADKPLSFLDHHLRQGDSLVGARLRDLRALPSGKKGAATANQATLLDEGKLTTDLNLAVGGMMAIERATSDSLEDIQLKETLFGDLRGHVAKWRTLANVWVSSYFGNGMSPEEYGDVARLLQGKQTTATSAQLQPFLDHPAVRDNDYFHWELEFPEVFFDEYGRSLQDAAGFDAVVGNPPYEELSSNERGSEIVEMSFLQQSGIYTEALGNRINLFRLFIVRSLLLINNQGFHGFIVPLSLLADKFSFSLREHILNNYKLVEIQQFPQKDDVHDRVFVDAKLSTCIYILQNTIPDDLTTVYVRTHQGRSIRDNSPSYTTYQFDFNSFDIINKSIPGLGEQEWNLVRKLAKLNRLGEVAESSVGELMINRSFEPYRSINKIGREVIRGSHIGLYEIVSPKQGEPIYFDKARYLHDHTNSKKAFAHKSSRIVYQRYAAIDNYRRLIAAMLPAGEFCSHTVGYLTNLNLLQPEFVLALLNSKLLDWRFNLTSTNNNINGYEIESLPIPIVEVSQANELSDATLEKVDSLFEEGKFQQLYTLISQKIKHEGSANYAVHKSIIYFVRFLISAKSNQRELLDQFWIDLEGVTELNVYNSLQDVGKWEESVYKKVVAARPFVREDSRSVVRLEATLGWNEAAFRGFVKLLAGKVRGLSDLVEVYRAYHGRYCGLRDRIAETDGLIDALVYQLYGLTEEEIGLVEAAV